ncbi:POT family MFS transporter [Verrucomicrobia bacterium]|nr:POT family MFS transporter [Verrucomicrobiota bacterium]MDA7670777.1 POT family MFS transporter [Verrucomicrobiota bacterium]MDB4642724.1 POT family MFS transporter [Verrucomicrobiota bacterium]MDB4690369.1 POT family MFS transporter [Verrucomicrobiota bacterium]MDB4778535.1 POT family MFS transporter [Verrucomicrobiota bacterium]
MAKPSYLTAPRKSANLPKGIPYIVGNEAAERFSYYGMRTILVIFMTQYLKNAHGELSPMTDAEAKVWYHDFMAWAYFFPILGAILSDAFLGKYRTIIGLSIVYCLGHLALALDETRTGLTVGLSLIAIGAGGIKPCVTAHVGDQFGASNNHLLSKVFGWFYWSINFGAFISTLLTPYLLNKYGPHWAFGIPGILMFLATIVFWLGRRQFVHIPAGGKTFFKETFSPQGLRAMGKLMGLYVFIIIFWSVYEQNGSAWVLQAKKMDLNWAGVEWLPSQIQAINPILVLIYIPLFTYVLYPAINKFFALNPLRKIGIGMFLTVPAVLVIAWIESQLIAGKTPTIAWQLLAYVFMTAAEVMIYQTGLELSYTQSPNSMKSIIMSFYLLTISAGNKLTSYVNQFIQNEDGSTKLGGVSYHLFFAGLILATTVLYMIYARFYKEQTYMQKEANTA